MVRLCFCQSSRFGVRILRMGSFRVVVDSQSLTLANTDLNFASTQLSVPTTYLVSNISGHSVRRDCLWHLAHSSKLIRSTSFQMVIESQSTGSGKSQLALTLGTSLIDVPK